MSAPGVPPVTIREVQMANRLLVSAMRRRKIARDRLASAEISYREARARVRTLLEVSQAQEGPGPVVRCEACGAPMGTGATCPECSATRVFVEGD